MDQRNFISLDTIVKLWYQTITGLSSVLRIHFLELLVWKTMYKSKVMTLFGDNENKQ